MGQYVKFEAKKLFKTLNVLEQSQLKYSGSRALRKLGFEMKKNVIPKQMKANFKIGDQAAPSVDITATVDEAIVEMTAKRLGATAVVENNTLKGIVTDGDLRRMLGNGQSSTDVSLMEIMSTNPRTIDESALALKGFELMEKHSISQLIVLNSAQKYVGIVHLHDILKEGIF